MKKIIFAAGCFWGVESSFMKINGVINTRVGYSGGVLENPTYEQVCGGNTGHAEAVEVTYDENIISFRDLVKKFFEIHNPTTKDSQGLDFGSQYRSAIFYNNEEEKQIIEKEIKELNESSKYSSEIVTEVTKFDKFFKAEEYHQKYIEKRNS